MKKRRRRSSRSCRLALGSRAPVRLPPAAWKVPMRVAIPAQAPTATGREPRLTPATKPAAHPPAAPFSASSVCCQLRSSGARHVEVYTVPHSTTAQHGGAGESDSGYSLQASYKHRLIATTGTSAARGRMCKADQGSSESRRRCTRSLDSWRVHCRRMARRSTGRALDLITTQESLPALRTQHSRNSPTTSYVDTLLPFTGRLT